VIKVLYKEKVHRLFVMLLIAAVMMVSAIPTAAEQAAAAAEIIRVPQDAADLQSAIQQVSDNGVIEIAAGTYASPAGGFKLGNSNRSFTIRGAAGATVVLDGQGQRTVLFMVNNSQSSGRPVVFQDLIIANGRSTVDGTGGGVTLGWAEATFIKVTFRNNSGSQPGSGGGGTIVSNGSTAFFAGCTWENNTAVNEGAGLRVSEGSRAYVHEARFTGNRTNLPGHRTTAAGGAIHVGNAVLRVSNSYFENNQAGYVGGAIYAIGTWQAPFDAPRADVIIANSTFSGNKAQRDASVSFPAPSEGGAVHAEDQALLRIYHSSFTGNSAEAGGAVNLFRARVEISESIFQGNRASGSGPGRGFGGAISAISSDGPADPVNYPPARLTVENTFIQGRHGGTGAAGQFAGGVYASGDSGRTFGLGGVPPMGSAGDNRAQVTLRNMIFYDLDVEEAPPAFYGYGHGGALLVDHTRLVVENALIARSDAVGTSNSFGGGFAILRDSWASISGAGFVQNTTQRYGGALAAQGSRLELTSCFLADNNSPTAYGSALFISQMNPGGEMPGLPALGAVQNCVFSSNQSLPHIYEDDKSYGPINDTRYNGSAFFQPAGAGQVVYSNPLAVNQSVSALNDLVITREGAADTKKSQIPNQALGSAPRLGKIAAAPSRILPVGSVDNPGAGRSAIVGYGWSGSSAVLNGAPVEGGAGFQSTSSPGSYTLDVGGTRAASLVSLGFAPKAAVQVCPAGGETQLRWNIESGSFLEAAADLGAAIPSQASGAAAVPAPGRNYALYAITREGGTFVRSGSSLPPWSLQEAVSVLVEPGQQPERSSVQLTNFACSPLAWTASAEDTFLSLDASYGQTASAGSLTFTVQVGQLSLGRHTASILVDAGDAGAKTARVEVHVAAQVYRVYAPLVQRR
jgi:hypothetical protein